MKKTIVTIIAVLAATLVLIGCMNKDQNKGEELNEKDLYAVSAVTGISDLKMSNVFNQLVNASRVNLSSNDDLTKETNDDVIENDTKYLDIMLNILNDNVYKTELVESDDLEFKDLLKITINQEEFLFYYNETLVKESIETEDDEHEEEYQYSINGYILNNEIKYEVNGKKEIEIETENNEREEELKLELKISLDDQNYSLIKYDFETEVEDGSNELEKELKFNTHSNGKLISKLNVKIEVEDNETEIKLTIKEKDSFKIYSFKNKNNKPQSIKYQIVESGKSTVKGRIEVELITDENGIINYQYK